MSAPAALLDRFEFLGDNCEPGFALRALGRQGAALFQWAALPCYGLLALLRADLTGWFQLANLRPAAPDMVDDDAFGIGWHSALRVGLVEGEWRYLDPPEKLARLHRHELARLDWLRDRFLARLRAGGLILIIKGKHRIPPAVLDDIAAELARLAQGAPHWLLEVRAAGPGESPGTVRVLGPQRLLGWVNAFAPYDQADKIDQHGYEEVLAGALSLAPWPAEASASPSTAPLA